MLLMLKRHVLYLFLKFSVVYKKGPSFYHSSFAVLAHLVEEGSEMTSALASWYNFTGFSRIIENAAKVGNHFC